MLRVDDWASMQRRSFILGSVAGASSVELLRDAGSLLARRLAETHTASSPVSIADRSEPQGASTEERSGRDSFAQQGEDLILYDLLHGVLKIETPTYVDLGAGDPVQGSNTYLLYQAGCRGVLVEPNPTLAVKLRNVRPHDVVVPMGVGVTDANEADYYIIRDRWPLNTFSREAVDRLRRQSRQDPVETILKMPLISINRLIAEHFGRAPDLLSTDIEGLDLAVLRTLDFKRFRPATICAETKGPGRSHDRTPIARVLRSRGYVACAGSLYNTIFVDRSLLP